MGGFIVAKKPHFWNLCSCRWNHQVPKFMIKCELCSRFSRHLSLSYQATFPMKAFWYQQLSKTFFFWFCWSMFLQKHQSLYDYDLHSSFFVSAGNAIFLVVSGLAYSLALLCSKYSRLTHKQRCMSFLWQWTEPSWQGGRIRKITKNIVRTP